MNHHPKCAFAFGLILVSVVPLSVPAGQRADDSKPFDGAKSTWHDGFDRYDYVMDAETLEIQPFERTGGREIRDQGPASGQAPVRGDRAEESPPQAIPGRGVGVTGTISRKPRSSCSNAGFTSRISRPTRT